MSQTQIIIRSDHHSTPAMGDNSRSNSRFNRSKKWIDTRSLHTFRVFKSTTLGGNISLAIHAFPCSRVPALRFRFESTCSVAPFGFVSVKNSTEGATHSKFNGLQ